MGRVMINIQAVFVQDEQGAWMVVDGRSCGEAGVQAESGQCDVLLSPVYKKNLSSAPTAAALCGHLNEQAQTTQ